MRNHFKSFAVLLVIGLFAFSACKKGNSNGPVVNLTALDSNKTTTVLKGGIIKITLSNPGDGGFNFNAWQYDSHILRLDSHSHIPPTDPSRLGDYGSDLWQFTSLTTGITVLKITASQAYTVTMFNGTIKVN